jgi:hypothetical protein
MRRDEIQNLLKSQNFETVKPTAFKQVGNPIFPDQSATDGMATVREIVDTFRAIHAPSYGSVIPRTGAKATVIGDSGTLLSLTGNQVARVIAIQAESTTLPETITILVDGVVYTIGSTDPTQSVNILDAKQPIIMDSNTPLTYTAVSATQSVTVLYYLLSQ